MKRIKYSAILLPFKAIIDILTRSADAVWVSMLNVIVGSVIAVFGAVYVAGKWNKDSMNYQARLELFKEINKERRDSIFAMSENMGRRMQKARKYVWNVRDQTNIERIEEFYRDYDAEKDQWNYSLQKNYIILDTYFPVNQFNAKDYVEFIGMEVQPGKVSVRDIYETQLQPMWIDFHQKITKLHGGKNKRPSNINDIEYEMKGVEVSTYRFIELIMKVNDDYNKRKLEERVIE